MLALAAALLTHCPLFWGCVAQPCRRTGRKCRKLGRQSAQTSRTRAAGAAGVAAGVAAEVAAGAAGARSGSSAAMMAARPRGHATTERALASLPHRKDHPPERRLTLEATHFHINVKFTSSLLRLAVIWIAAAAAAPSRRAGLRSSGWLAAASGARCTCRSAGRHSLA